MNTLKKTINIYRTSKKMWHWSCFYFIMKAACCISHNKSFITYWKMNAFLLDQYEYAHLLIFCCFRLSFCFVFFRVRVNYSRFCSWLFYVTIRNKIQFPSPTSFHTNQMQYVLLDRLKKNCKIILFSNQCTDYFDTSWSEFSLTAQRL